MTAQMTSRERMLAAIGSRPVDYVPCSFMLFRAMRSKAKNDVEFLEKQVELGLDPMAWLPFETPGLTRATSEATELHGFSIHLPREVASREWCENIPGERYPLLHREYTTPAGKLRTAVHKTEDWEHGNHLPLFDDFVIPRAKKHLVSGPEDLPALKHLLVLPAKDAVAAYRERAAALRKVAARLNLLVSAKWGALFDTACWLAGIENLAMLAYDNPAFFAELLGVLGQWNRKRMEFMLDGGGVDLFVRRGWYETADFLSPETYRKHILPELKREVKLAHQAGAKFGLISTSSYTPLLDQYLEAGLDVLIGLDPVQDPRKDFPLAKKKLGGKVATWGGVNGFVTVEHGSPEEVRAEVRAAMQTLGPGGGFILSPVDNVTLDEPRVWANVDALIAEWKKWRAAPGKA